MDVVYRPTLVAKSDVLGWTLLYFVVEQKACTSIFFRKLKNTVFFKISKHYVVKVDIVVLYVYIFACVITLSASLVQFLLFTVY